MDDNSGSDVSQPSLEVPSANDSSSTTADDHTVPRLKKKKKEYSGNGTLYYTLLSLYNIHSTVGVDLSPPILSSYGSSSSSSSDGTQSQFQHSQSGKGFLGIPCIVVSENFLLALCVYLT